MKGYYPMLMVVFGVCALGVLPAQAQKAPRDIRPLHGPLHTTPPTLPSAALLRDGTPAALRNRAVVVDTAVRVMRPVPARRVHRIAGAGKQGRSGLPVHRLARAANGTVRWMQGRLGQAGPAPAGKRAATAHYIRAARSVLQAHAHVLRLDDPAVELRSLGARWDDLGYMHARFEQVYAGLPVWGRDLYVHFDAQGSAYAINGTYEPTPRGVDTVPALTAEAARAVTVDDLKARQRWAPIDEAVAQWLGMEETTRLVLYPDDTGAVRPAYEVTLHPSFLEWYTYLVDARSGALLHRLARHCTLRHDEAARPPAATVVLDLPTPGSGATGTFFDATGVDLNGQTQALRVYQHDDGIFYKLWDLPNLDEGRSSFPVNPAGGAMTLTANNRDIVQGMPLDIMASADNTWLDQAAVSAHVNMKIAFDYYRDTHGRDAIDDRGSSLLSVVHVTEDGQPMDNAFWNGRLMAYGDGSQVFKSLSGGLDVAVHEMTHGVVQESAGLVYQFQPGALNESFADVFGSMVDRDDFLIGEDIMLPGAGVALRDMENPNNPNVFRAQPAHMSQFQVLSIGQDNGGVHINSGIPNRAAILVIQRIGYEKAERIYFRALDNYLTKNSQFGDARDALEQSAEDLFGAGSPEQVAVQDAFDAVGVTSTTGGGEDDGNNIPPQTGGQSVITFLLEDGTIGILDVTDPGNLQVGTFDSPLAVARAHPDLADWAQLTTTRDGSRIWFVNQDLLLAFLDVESGAVSVFEGLFLDQPGDLWNASIAPDGSVAALVSAYVDDPNLYITDGNDVGVIPLKPETTQEGILDETIKFPDVVAWSPNPVVPRIALDALNEVSLGFENSTISYWSIYEIDFTAEKVYSLLPAQPTDISTGNVTYSNSDPDVIAFNVFDETGVSDVLLGNFETGEIVSLGLPSFSIDGEPVTDAQRPTFAPDDSELCVSSPSRGLLLFTDGDDLTGVDLGSVLGSAVYNPRWFTVGGSGGTQNQAPTARFSATTDRGDSPLLIRFDASASSDPEGGQLTYRWDFGDGSTGSGVTTEHNFVIPGAFTVTLTVVDSGGRNSAAALEVQINDTGTAIEAVDDELPDAVTLYPNYPNPFNPATILRFGLPEPVEAVLRVIDLRGRTVATLVREPLPAGTHEVHFDAEGLASGTYLIRLQAGSVVRTRAVVLLR